MRKGKELTYKPDFEELDKRVEQGYLRKVISPCGKLKLYNYTNACTYDKAWDEHTLNSRGTVYEISTGKVVARAFPKFFNYGELHPVEQNRILKETNFTVAEKMDGSLGIVYFYDGTWRVNTRGSFTSDQAIKATEMLEKYNMNMIQKNITVLVEIIYPENRIIVDYGNDEKLVVLSYFKGDEEVNPAQHEREHDTDITGLSFAPVIEFTSIESVIESQSKLSKMEEGFVIRLQDGYRVKFKSAEYLKVARLLSEMTPLNFWKAMTDGVVQSEILEEIPEEFRAEADRIKDELELAYTRISQEVYKDFVFCIKSIGGTCNLEDDRKNLGLFLKEHTKEITHNGGMFSMLLNDNSDKYIMKVIRPKANKVDV